NLFLAGEFPDCIFVFGMDAEMVAAALEQAHGDVIAKLPSYAGHIPIGWRFMDKFVQLPFVIPPPEMRDIDNYMQSLFEDEGKKQPLPTTIKNKIDEVAAKLASVAVAEAISDVEDFVKREDLSDQQKKEAAIQMEQMKEVAAIDAEIDRAS